MWISLLIFWITMAAMVHAGEHATDGRFVYPLDDTYIHMSMARCLLKAGTWGVIPGRFGPAGSSLLWGPTLAAGFAVFGFHDLLPLLAASLSASGVLIAADWIFRRQGLQPISIAALLVLIIFGVPLPVLAYSGMEHAAQCCVDLMFVYVASLILSGPLLKPHRWHLLMCGLAALMTGIRFEGLFIAFTAAVLFLIHRRWRLAVAVGVSAIAPVILYSMLAIHQGGLYLPNSVLLKGNRPHWNLQEILAKPMGIQAIKALGTTPVLSSLLLAGAGALAYGWASREADPRTKLARNFLVITATATLLHLQFAQLGWYFRYEGYLIAALLVGIPLALWPHLRNRPMSLKPTLLISAGALAVVVTLAVSTLPPICARSQEAFWTSPRASQNIYMQQIQTARFLKKYYLGKTVAANDIGAITYYAAGIGLVDVYGLDNLHIAEKKLNGTLTPHDIAEEIAANHTAIAAVYDSDVVGWNSEWIPIARMTIPNNVICGCDTVTFYAIDPAEEQALRQNLHAFVRELPGGVRVVFVSNGATTRPDSSPRARDLQ